LTKLALAERKTSNGAPFSTGRASIPLAPKLKRTPVPVDFVNAAPNSGPARAMSAAAATRICA